MKKYRIYYWHGRTEKLEARVAKICKSDKENFFWEGTLDSFVDSWKDKFILLPYPQEEFAGVICVTDEKSWGQC